MTPAPLPRSGSASAHSRSDLQWPSTRRRLTAGASTSTTTTLVADPVGMRPPSCTAVSAKRWAHSMPDACMPSSRIGPRMPSVGTATTLPTSAGPIPAWPKSSRTTPSATTSRRRTLIRSWRRARRPAGAEISDSRIASVPKQERVLGFFHGMRDRPLGPGSVDRGCDDEEGHRFTGPGGGGDAHDAHGGRGAGHTGGRRRGLDLLRQRSARSRRPAARGTPRAPPTRASPTPPSTSPTATTGASPVFRVSTRRWATRSRP